MTFDLHAAGPHLELAAATLVINLISSMLIANAVEGRFGQHASASPGLTPLDLANLASYSCDLSLVFANGVAIWLLIPAIDGSTNADWPVISAVLLGLVNLGLFAVTIAKVGPAKYANLVFPKPDKDALHRRKKRGLHLAFSYLLLAAVGFTAVVGLLFGFASAKQAESAGNLSPASSTSSSPP